MIPGVDLWVVSVHWSILHAGRITALFFFPLCINWKIRLWLNITIQPSHHIIRSRWSPRAVLPLVDWCFSFHCFYTVTTGSWLLTAHDYFAHKYAFARFGAVWYWFLHLGARIPLFWLFNFWLCLHGDDFFVSQLSRSGLQGSFHPSSVFTVLVVR